MTGHTEVTVEFENPCYQMLEGGLRMQWQLNFEPPYWLQQWEGKGQQGSQQGSILTHSERSVNMMAFLKSQCRESEKN
jgi:hypothetical protein